MAIGVGETVGAGDGEDVGTGDGVADRVGAAFGRPVIAGLRVDADVCVSFDPQADATALTARQASTKRPMRMAFRIAPIRSPARRGLPLSAGPA
jgi:hypothetical protein